MSGRRVNGPEGFIDPEDLRKHQLGNYSGANISITELKQTGRFGDYTLEARGQGPSQPSVSDAPRQPTGLWSGKNVSVPLKKDCKKMGEKVNGSVGRQRAETSSFIKDGRGAVPEKDLQTDEIAESLDEFLNNASFKDLTKMTSDSSAGEQELGNVDIGLHEAPHHSEKTVSAQQNCSILPQGVRKPPGYIEEPVKKRRKMVMPDDNSKSQYQHLQSPTEDQMKQGLLESSRYINYAFGGETMMVREPPDYTKDPVGNIVRKSVLPDFESLLSQPLDCCLWPEGQCAAQKQTKPSHSKDQMEPSLCGSDGHLNSAFGELGEVRKEPGGYSVDTVGKMAKNMMMSGVSPESQLSQAVVGSPWQEGQFATQQQSLDQMEPGPFESLLLQTVGSSPWQEGQCATQQQILNQMERGLFGSSGNSNSAFGEPGGGGQQVSPEEEDIPTVPLNLDNMGIDPDLPLNTGNMDFDQDLYPDLWDLDV